MLAGGHVLLDDVPGTGKTTLAKAISQVFDCDFGRVQFTPDLLPSELTGMYFYSPKTGEFTFRKGALFANILLADEINRATPRTQSGLLESMEETQITVDGTMFKLPQPYFVIATQNPVETQGTFPLPEAQLDRFLVRTGLGYPSSSETAALVQSGGVTQNLSELKPVCDTEAFLEMRKTVETVTIHELVADYIVRLAEHTRTNAEVALGVSTRGCLALAKMSRAFAACDGRGFITPDDVKRAVNPVFCHRIILKSGRRSAANVIDAALSAVDVPVEDWK
jgi:MoxR-like ATPase